APPGTAPRPADPAAARPARRSKEAPRHIPRRPAREPAPRASREEVAPGEEGREPVPLLGDRLPPALEAVHQREGAADPQPRRLARSDGLGGAGAGGDHVLHHRDLGAVGDEAPALDPLAGAVTLRLLPDDEGRNGPAGEVAGEAHRRRQRVRAEGEPTDRRG